MFETVKVANQVSRLRSQSQSPMVPGSSPTSLRSSRISTPRTSYYESDSLSVNLEDKHSPLKHTEDHGSVSPQVCVCLLWFSLYKMNNKTYSSQVAGVKAFGRAWHTGWAGFRGSAAVSFRATGEPHVRAAVLRGGEREKTARPAERKQWQWRWIQWIPDAQWQRRFHRN